jgi:hypothetical protein
MAQPRAIGSRLSDVLAKVERDLEGVRDEFLTIMADDLVASSPVWSGRYVTSHSIGASSSAGRFTENLEGWQEKTTVPEAYKAEARGNLRADIAALPRDAQRVYINNNAPHAQIVEHGNARVPAHKVYESVINRADVNLQKAINNVRGRQ